MRSGLLLMIALFGCGDRSLVSGTLLDGSGAPITDHEVECVLGPDRSFPAVTDEAGQFVCEVVARDDYSIGVATWWNDIYLRAIGVLLVGDNDMGPLWLLEQPATATADGLDVELSWPEDPAPGLQHYVLKMGADSVGLALNHLTEKTSVRIPAIALEDWQLEVRVLHVLEQGEFQVDLYSPAIELTGETPALSRGAACRYTFVDSGTPEVVTQGVGECMFTDGELYSLGFDNDELSEVVVDLGAAVDASQIVVRDLVSSADDELWPPAEEETFVVEVGLTEADYRATTRLPAEGVKAYGVNDDQPIRFVRLRAEPARGSWLAEVSVF